MKYIVTIKIRYTKTKFGFKSIYAADTFIKTYLSAFIAFDDYGDDGARPTVSIGYVPEGEKSDGNDG